MKIEFEGSEDELIAFAQTILADRDYSPEKVREITSENSVLKEIVSGFLFNIREYTLRPQRWLDVASEALTSERLIQEGWLECMLCFKDEVFQISDEAEELIKKMISSYQSLDEFFNGKETE